MIFKYIRLFIETIKYNLNIRKQIYSSYYNGDNRLKKNDKTKIKYSKYRKQYYIIVNNEFILKIFSRSQCGPMKYYNCIHYLSFNTKIDAENTIKLMQYNEPKPKTKPKNVDMNTINEINKIYNDLSKEFIKKHNL